MIKERLKVYLPFITPFKNLEKNPIAVDIGCGRGEWLELLHENGFTASGVDLDDGMVDFCKSKNLNVIKKDAVVFLKELEANSVSLISAFHIVEHLAIDDLREMVTEIYRVLKPGGLVILETPNPESLMVSTYNFYFDPTHKNPIPSELLSFILEFTKFERVKTLYLQELVKVKRDSHIGVYGILNGVSADYASIGQKRASGEIFSLWDSVFNNNYGMRLNEIVALYDQKNIDIHQKISHLENRVNDLNSVIQAVFHSNSWKITAPLRAVITFLRNLTK